MPLGGSTFGTSTRKTTYNPVPSLIQAFLSGRQLSQSEDLHPIRVEQAKLEAQKAREEMAKMAMIRSYFQSQLAPPGGYNVSKDPFTGSAMGGVGPQEQAAPPMGPAIPQPTAKRPDIRSDPMMRYYLTGQLPSAEDQWLGSLPPGGQEQVFETKHGLRPTAHQKATEATDLARLQQDWTKWSMDFMKGIQENNEKAISGAYKGMTDVLGMMYDIGPQFVPSAKGILGHYASIIERKTGKAPDIDVVPPIRGFKEPENIQEWYQKENIKVWLKSQYDTDDRIKEAVRMVHSTAYDPVVNRQWQEHLASLYQEKGISADVVRQPGLLNWVKESVGVGSPKYMMTFPGGAKGAVPGPSLPPGMGAPAGPPGAMPPPGTAPVGPSQPPPVPAPTKKGAPKMTERKPNESDEAWFNRLRDANFSLQDAASIMTGGQPTSTPLPSLPVPAPAQAAPPTAPMTPAAPPTDWYTGAPRSDIGRIPGDIGWGAQALLRALFGESQGMKQQREERARRYDRR